MIANYDLNDENFLIYSMKAYEKPNCIMSEFDSDIKRVKYVKRLLNKYLQSGDLKERLILNHIIILSNVFGADFTTRMLFFKLEEEYYSLIKTFLLYLNMMPERINSIEGNVIISSDILIDMNVVNKLRRI